MSCVCVCVGGMGDVQPAWWLKWAGRGCGGEEEARKHRCSASVLAGLSSPPMETDCCLGEAKGD